MNTEPIYVTFEFNGNLGEEVTRVKLGIQGLRDESASTYKRLIADSNEAFTAMSKQNQQLAISIQEDINSLRQLEAVQKSLDDAFEKGSITASEYAEAQAKLSIQEADLRSGIQENIKILNDNIEAERQSVDSIQSKQAELSKLEDSYKKLSATERESASGQEMLSKIKSLKSELSDLDDSYKKATDSTQSFGQTVQAIPGPIGQTAQAIGKMTKAALAFIATPLGMILAAIAAGLAAVSSWFNRTEEGQNALAVGTAAFSQVLNSLLDVVDSVGEWLYKAFTSPKEALGDLVDFLEGQVMNRLKAVGKMGQSVWKILNGDVKEGFADLANAQLQFATGIEDAGKKAAAWADDVKEKTKQSVALQERRNVLDEKERDMLVERSEMQAEINQLRDQAYDMSIPEKKRSEALKKALDLTDELYKKEQDIAKEKYDIIKTQNSLSNSNKEDLRAEKEAQAEISNIEAQRYSARRMMLRQSNTLDGKSGKNGASQLKAQTELNRSILETELKLQSERIAVMQDGKDKRIALAQQETRETIAVIQKEKEEYQKKIKETKGKEDPTVIKTFDSREDAANAKEKTDIAKIEKEYAEEYKQRTKVLTDVFLNEEQRKLSAIKERYNQERKWANEQLRTGGMTKNEHKSYTSNIDKAEQKETYRSMLDDLNDYKQQEKDLREKWDTDINAAVEAKDAYLVAKLQEGKQKALSTLNGQMLQESTEWQQLFGNLDNLTVAELEKLSSTIKKKAKDLKLNPVDAQAVTNSLKEVDEQIRAKNPFESLSKHLKEYKAAENDATKKDTLKDMFRDTAASIDMVKGGFDSVVGGLTEMGLAGDEATQELLGDISNLMGAASQLATSIASANPVGIIQGSIGVLTSVFNIFNNDRKHERKIKELQKEVDNLSRAYDRLGRAIENTYSNEVYNLMDGQVENLKKQQQLVLQQMREEQEKKHTDDDKVQEYKDKYEELGNQIEDTKKKQIEMLAGTDIQSAIDNFADALVEAYAQGEDGAKAMGETTKKVLANAVKEALKKQILGKALENAVTQLGKNMEDGVLTDAEKKQFEDAANSAGNRFMEAMKMYDDLFKDATAATTREATAKGLEATASQDSVDALNGKLSSQLIFLDKTLVEVTGIREQMSFIRELQVKGWEDVRAIRELSSKVSDNTNRIAELSEKIVDVSDKIEVNTSKAARTVQDIKDSGLILKKQ